MYSKQKKSAGLSYTEVHHIIYLDNYSVIQNEQSYPKSRRIRYSIIWRKETMNVGAKVLENIQSNFLFGKYLFKNQLYKSPVILRNNSIQ